MTARHALITGASGGIGSALVECFAGAGYHVIAVDRATAPSGLAATFVPFDIARVVRDEQAAHELVARVAEATGNDGITCLVNNAAIQPLGATQSVTRQAWLDGFDVNLHAPFFLVQAFLEQLARNRGSVVNISSIHATQTKAGFVAYATTKGALSSLTRNLAVDLGDRVRVNAIEPAAVDTDMLRAGFAGKDAEYAELQSAHPVGRIATPREIAETAVFLASDKARFIHGACIAASGGIHARLHDPD